MNRTTVESQLPRSDGARREGQTFAGESLAARYASFVKLPHTLFALPFVGVGAVLASYAHPDGITSTTIFWIVLAFTAARFAAMGFNRIVDRHYDALNPRTRLRELPSGRLSKRQAWTAVVSLSLVFVFAAAQLNPLCGWLAPAALAWIFFYSYTKRFTSWAHNVLGIALGIAPVGAFLAVAGEWSEPWYALVVLAAAVMFWVGGFDIIYSLQDLEFDREQGLHSIPARQGLRRGLTWARIFHALAVVLFFLLWLTGAFPVRWVYVVGVLAMAALLLHEHALVRGQTPRQLAFLGRPAHPLPAGHTQTADSPGELDILRIDRAFFRVNVAVSTTFFVLVLLDRLLLA